MDYDVGNDDETHGDDPGADNDNNADRVEDDRVEDNADRVEVMTMSMV